MPKRSSIQIIEEIKKVLENEPDLSIRQIANKIKCEWRIANHNLNLMKATGGVLELPDQKSKRGDRRFRLAK